MIRFMSIWLSVEVVAVNPIEIMFFPCDYVVPQINSSTRDGAVEVAMGRRLTERILQVQETESSTFSTHRPNFVHWADARQDRRPRQDAGVGDTARQLSALYQFLLL